MKIGHPSLDAIVTFGPFFLIFNLHKKTVPHEQYSCGTVKVTY